MLFGLLSSIYIPSARHALNSNKIAGVSLPIAIGLLCMMYPVLCKVKYEKLVIIFKKSGALRNLSISMFLNWIIAPLFMFALAWITLPDLPHLRTGIILIGVARCIAMVLIWNDLADGDPEWCAILVAVNAVLQLFLFSPLAYLLTVVIGGNTTISIEIWLGIPLLAGALTRFAFKYLLKNVIDSNWYENRFLPLISPLSLGGLLFTIYVMFTLQGVSITNDIGSVLRATVPLLLYFFFIFFGTFYLCYRFKSIPYEIAVTQSFTAAGNNFELAIAIAVASFGIDSKESLTTVIGPLIEVPVLVAFVHIALAARAWYERPLVNKLDLESPLKEKVEDSSCSSKNLLSTSIIFVCKMNSCRSQMAEGFAKAHAKDFFSRIESAGLNDKFEVNTTAKKVMMDVGIDLSEHASKALFEFSPSEFGIVVSLCGCSATLPEEWLNINRVEDWNVMVKAYIAFFD
ncbi:hypothetical protein HDU92_001057 [Lobulomyces angularis]|nr:hypothetical protein HDU92_001057 [Lobulomyces angularis]